MNEFSIIQFFTLIFYAILAVLVVLHGKTKLRQIFLVYLLLSLLWSLSSFLLHVDFAREQAYFWVKILPFAAISVTVVYTHFIAIFVRRDSRITLSIGYALLTVLGALIIMGYIPKGMVTLGDSNIGPDYGLWIIFMQITGLYCVISAVVWLVRDYRSSRNIEQRNKIIYLLLGIGLWVSLGMAYSVLPKPTYPIDHIGHMGNAIIISFAVFKHSLLDAKLVVRKGLAHASIATFITGMFVLLLSGLYLLLHDWATPYHLGATIVLAMTIAWTFNPIKAFSVKIIDKIFFGKNYEYREMILNFSRRMSNVIDLDELAEAIVNPVAQAMQARQVSLLLPNKKSFGIRYGARLIHGEPLTPIEFRQDSTIITWLARENKPLLRKVTEIDPEFKGLWAVDSKALDAANVELLFPMITKGKLIGLLVLSSKSKGLYSSDDIDVIMTFAHEAAVVIHNAQLYEQARERANTDGLTGLFNHRYFHERLDEEIVRCSRFGETFTLMLIDLDLFKTYNDIYGHLAGDEIIRQVSQCLKSSLRRVDIGFRYGGDEFAVLLPQTSLEDSQKVAQRIRRAISNQTESKGIPISCSIGLGSWPTDGVMRNDIVEAVDAAMYHAKQTGRDRVCYASEVAPSEEQRMGIQTGEDSTILNTVYALAATVDAKDHYTYGHSKKVSQYAVEIATALGYSQNGIASIRTAALLHDIGKIGISDEILGKPSTISNDDWEQIKAHPDLGVAILKHLNALTDCLAAVQYHHEHYNGSGYPSGLKGDNIPLDARILAVADSYDAMTSERPYRPKKLTPEEGLQELRRCACTQFDPMIVQVFVDLRINARNIRKAKKEASEAIRLADHPATTGSTPVTR